MTSFPRNRNLSTRSGFWYRLVHSAGNESYTLPVGILRIWQLVVHEISFDSALKPGFQRCQDECEPSYGVNGITDRSVTTKVGLTDAHKRGIPAILEIDSH